MIGSRISRSGVDRIIERVLHSLPVGLSDRVGNRRGGGNKRRTNLPSRVG